jgi:hypothetical protein
MSTRSFIGYSDGQLHGIYCHYDGYPGYVGEILVKHHNSFTALESIIDGSHIRNFDNDGTICRFGEGDGAAETFDSIKEVLSSGYDYVYLWSDDGCWKCFGRDRDRIVREFDIPGNTPWETA